MNTYADATYATATYEAHPLPPAGETTSTTTGATTNFLTVGPIVQTV